MKKLEKLEKKKNLIYDNIVLGETPIYLRMFIYLSRKIDLSEEINIKICIIKKSKKSIATKL